MASISRGAHHLAIQECEQSPSLRTWPPSKEPFPLGNGYFIIQQGEVWQRYQCRPIHVYPMTRTECYSTLPVTTRHPSNPRTGTNRPGKGLFLEPHTRRLLHDQKPLPHCNSTLPQLYVTRQGLWINAHNNLSTLTYPWFTTPVQADSRSATAQLGLVALRTLWEALPPHPSATWFQTRRITPTTPDLPNPAPLTSTNPLWWASIDRPGLWWAGIYVLSLCLGWSLRALVRTYIHYDNASVEAWEILFPSLGQLYMAYWLRRHGSRPLLPTRNRPCRITAREGVFLFMCSRAYRIHQGLGSSFQGANVRDFMRAAANWYLAHAELDPTTEPDSVEPEMDLPPTPPELDIEVEGMPIPPTPPELGLRLSPRTPTPSAPVPRNPNVAFPFRGPHDRLRVRPAHHSEGFSMQELRLYVDEHLPSNEPPEVPN
jgi:hypothetical protein